MGMILLIFFPLSTAESREESDGIFRSFGTVASNQLQYFEEINLPFVCSA